MNNQYITGHVGWSPDYKTPPKPLRLEGMQGPEQGLVGESRSDLETGPAEAVKPGERGVGEIVELAELRRIVERGIEKAREEKRQSQELAQSHFESYHRGWESALICLLADIDRLTEKRSDLSND